MTSSSAAPLHRIRRVCSIVLILLLTASCSAGGSSESAEPGPSDVEPVAWAAQVCGAIGMFIGEIRSATATVFGAEVSDPAQARDRLTAVLDGADSSLDEAIADIIRAGSPDVEDGAAIADDLVERLGKIRVNLQEIAEEAESMPTDDVESFSGALDEIGASIDENTPLLNQAGEALTDDTPELQEAFGEASECRTLNEP